MLYNALRGVCTLQHRALLWGLVWPLKDISALTQSVSSGRPPSWPDRCRRRRWRRGLGHRHSLGVLLTRTSRVYTRPIGSVMVNVPGPPQHTCMILNKKRTHFQNINFIIHKAVILSRVFSAKWLSNWKPPSPDKFLPCSPLAQSFLTERFFHLSP